MTNTVHPCTFSQSGTTLWLVHCLVQNKNCTASLRKCTPLNCLGDDPITGVSYKRKPIVYAKSLSRHHTLIRTLLPLRSNEVFVDCSFPEPRCGRNSTCHFGKRCTNPSKLHQMMFAGRRLCAQSDFQKEFRLSFLLVAAHRESLGGAAHHHLVQKVFQACYPTCRLTFLMAADFLEIKPYLQLVSVLGARRPAQACV